MESKGVKKKGWYWGGLLLIGVITSSSRRFVNSSFDETIVLLIALGSALFYYWLKSKIPIKNNLIKIVFTFVITELIAGALTGVLTTYF